MSVNIYPETFESKLKFEKIRELLAEQCLSNLGKEYVETMLFSDSFENVKVLQEQTAEVIRIETEGQQLPTDYFIDVRQGLKRIRIEGLFLDEQELFDLRRSLGTIRDIIRFIKTKTKEDYPRLHDLAAPVMVYPTVIERIDTILNKNGQIKDNASPELARIKKELTEKRQFVSKKMLSILKQAQQSGLVDDDVNVSIRDGRAVIPVLSANKRKLPGIIHDESSSGRTTYIEPAEIVEINNHIRELEYAERREITRILIEISTFLRPYLDDLMFSYTFLGLIDFIRAKSRFAVRVEAITPEMCNEQQFRWINARHPLLEIQLKIQGKTIVPLSIETCNNQRIIVISGPNAGGKSVCLQTVGIIQYMLQCGLPVPVKEGSKMGFFSKIFLDLGDEQSIENDLSTYSSHLLNMKIFIKQSDNRSLVLIDELGTGTEPSLGGAIAESVLEQLNNQRVYGIITTHYTNLKHFASENAGIVNGAMLFDTHNIRPLFILEIGQPGSSFAFEIARKTGLPENILDSARKKLGEDRINYDKHLREIIRDKRYWEQKRNSVKEQERKLENLVKKYETEFEKLTKERKDILKKAREEALAIVTGANREIENAIRQIRESQADKEKTKIIRQKIDELKENILSEDKKDETKEETESSQKKNIFDTIEEGDFVKFQGQPIPGEVIEIKGQEALVAFGQLITKIKTARLEKLSKKEIKKEIRQNNITSILSERLRKKKLDFTPDIDLRGMRAEEALNRVSEHLDGAVMCGVGQVRILHGKGNGILRQIIREQLAVIPFVTHFADEHIQFGGAGITVVTIE